MSAQYLQVASIIVCLISPIQAVYHDQRAPSVLVLKSEIFLLLDKLFVITKEPYLPWFWNQRFSFFYDNCWQRHELILLGALVIWRRQISPFAHSYQWKQLCLMKARNWTLLWEAIYCACLMGHFAGIRSSFHQPSQQWQPVYYHYYYYHYCLLLSLLLLLAFIWVPFINTMVLLPTNLKDKNS